LTAQQLRDENTALRQAQSRASPSSVPTQAAPAPTRQDLTAVPDVRAPAASVRDSASRPGDDTQQVMRVLQRYRAGYEALDAKAIAAVYPSANVANLQSALNQLSKLSYDVNVHVDGIVIAADGQTASVTASETFRSTPKIGSAPPQSGTAVFTMRKAGGAWTIADVKSNTR
jgi:ketosteroid isomerase-like protein